MTKLESSEIKKRLSKIKLIVSDVDGTLTNSDNQVGELTRELAPKLREKGIMLTFATQRVHSSIVPHARELGIELPIITANGALIQDIKGNAVFKSIIHPKFINKALSFCNKYLVRIAFVYNDEIVYTEDNSVLKDFMYRLGTEYRLVESYEEYKDSVIEIIMMGNEKKVVRHIQNKMNYPFRLFITAKYYRSSSRLGVYNLEIKRSGTNKRTAMKRLSKYLNLNKNEVAVLGDWFNDRELFEYGGFNVALQNAVAELKMKSHYITEKTNEEDGVGEFLKLVYDNI